MAKRQFNCEHTAKGKGNAYGTKGRKYTQTADTFKPKAAGLKFGRSDNRG